MGLWGFGGSGIWLHIINGGCSMLVASPRGVERFDACGSQVPPVLAAASIARLMDFILSHRGGGGVLAGAGA